MLPNLPNESTTTKQIYTELRETLETVSNILGKTYLRIYVVFVMHNRIYKYDKARIILEMKILA